MNKIKTLITRISLAVATVIMSFGLVPVANAQYLGTNGRIIYGGIGDTSGLATIMPNGTNIHVHGAMQNLSSRRFAVYSPDGTQFAWSQVVTGSPNHADIYTGAVAASVTGTARTNDTATNDMDPYYSADGSRIVFTRQTIQGGGSEIWVMNADGTGQTQLTDQINSGDSFMAVFDPSDTNNLYILNDGGANGTRIYRISSTTANQNSGTLIFDPTVGTSVNFLDVHPNGNTLLYVVANTTTNREQIRSVTTAGASDTAISQDNNEDYTTAAYSPDGTMIASEKCSNCVDDEDIMVMMSADGSNETSILSSTAQNDVILTSVSYWGTNNTTYSDTGTPGGTGNTPGVPNSAAISAIKKNTVPIALGVLSIVTFIGLGAFWIRKELKK